MRHTVSNQILFVWILLGFNALAIGFYFSGNSVLQGIVAPTMDSLRPSQWREFGILETVQHVLLIATIWMLIRSALTRTNTLEKITLFVVATAFVFLFLEEIDYGLHYYEYITGEHFHWQVRNWHNQWDSDVENATVLKRLNDGFIIIWFILLPLITTIKPVGRWLAGIPLIPSTWFVVAFMLSVICSKFAHYLDDQGMAVINGIAGNLDKSIAEFRETSTYYLYFIYVYQISKISPLFYRKNS